VKLKKNTAIYLDSEQRGSRKHLWVCSPA